jgi:hypothetical protein
MLLNLFGPLKKNFILVHLLSRLVKVGKKKLNLLLMFPSKSENIKLTHTIPPLEELKRRAYCKFHNSFSHVLMIAMMQTWQRCLCPCVVHGLEKMESSKVFQVKKEVQS